MEKYDQVELNDVFDNIVKPGDKVYAISSSGGVWRCTKGVYLGCSGEGRAKVLVKQKRAGFFHKKTGVKVWPGYFDGFPMDKRKEYEFRYEVVKKVTTLELNRVVKREN